MLWRKFNGDLIELPIAREVENAIRRETKNGLSSKSLYRNRLPG